MGRTRSRRVPGRAWATGEAIRLAEVRATAIEDLAEALLERGRSNEAIALLEPHIRNEEFRDRPRGLLMGALSAAGRPTEPLRDVHSDRRVHADSIEANLTARDLAGRVLDTAVEPTPLTSPNGGGASVGPDRTTSADFGHRSTAGSFRARDRTVPLATEREWDRYVRLGTSRPRHGMDIVHVRHVGDVAAYLCGAGSTTSCDILAEFAQLDARTRSGALTVAECADFLAPAGERCTSTRRSTSSSGATFAGPLQRVIEGTAVRAI